MDYLTKVKYRIGLKDNRQDEQLKVIIESVTAELLSRLPIDMREDVPEGLEFIVIEVTLKRYNRIGAEGMSSESQDGRSSTYEPKDFDEYLPIIDRFFPVETIEREGSIKFY